MFLKIKEESKENNTESGINRIGESIRTDKQGNPITGDRLQELLRLEQIKNKTQAESRRFHALRKYGNNARLERIQQHGATAETAEILNERPNDSLITQQTNPDRVALNLIIEQIENGNDILKAIKSQNMRPSKFYKLLEKNEFSEEKTAFLRARTILADFYLFKVNQLQEWLLAGKIDNCTYSNLSRDALYLAGKLAPAAYGDKIQIESKSISATVHKVDSDSFRRLNELMNGRTRESDPLQITDESAES